MRKRKKGLSMALSAVVLMALVIPAHSTITEAAAKDTKLSRNTITLETGQKKTIKLKNYTKLSKKKIKKVKWSTSNKKIVTVKAFGSYKQQAKITAKKSGTAAVKVRYDGKSYQCAVYVKSKEASSSAKQIMTEKTTNKSTTEQSNAKSKTEQLTVQSTTEQPAAKNTVEQTDKQDVTEQSTKKPNTEQPVLENEACVHIWNDGVVTKAADCTERGLKTYTCTKCGETKTESVPKDYSKHTFNRNHECNGCGVMDEKSAYKTYFIGDSNAKINIYTYQENGEDVIYIKQFGEFQRAHNGFHRLMNEIDVNPDKIIFLNKVNGGVSLYQTFAYYPYPKLKEIIHLDYLDTSYATDMTQMFNGCKNLKALDLSHFVTTNVKKMYLMFGNCPGLTTLDLSHFDTSSVTNMSNMFYNCTNLQSLNVSRFDTSKVTDMSAMFADCPNLAALDVSSFHTGKVTDMHYMFCECRGLSTLDLSSFDVSNVTNKDKMFEHAGDDKTIYVKDEEVQKFILSTSEVPSSWSVENVVIKK